MKKSMIEGSAAEEAGESPQMEQHEIDRHVETLHNAEKIKGNPHMMKQLEPHIAKHKAAAGKITSIAQLKEVAKKKIAEPDGY